MHEFDLLTPHVVVSAVEAVTGFGLDGTMLSYPSYVNRVYGLTSDEGEALIVKFYRPDRWSDDAILEEHEFVTDCARAEIPVVAPIVDEYDETLHTVVAESEDGEREYRFALFPKRGGRNFDAETESDWLRLGRLVGRLHTVARGGSAAHRLVCRPSESTAGFLRELSEQQVVPPNMRHEFFELADTALDRISGGFEGVPLHRIHGDCHRGNILDRADGGLLLIDFDDMMMGPAVQDLWLLLPGRAADSRQELALLVEGYEDFLPFDWTTLSLIEPLRIMRMIYYLAWCARQRQDARFLETFPDWGTEAFWIKEIEDLRDQMGVIRGG